MRRPLIVLAVMVTAILVASSAIAYAHHSWGGYHWARQAKDLNANGEFTLKLGDNVSGAWDPILATTSSDWSTSAMLDTKVATGGTTPKQCRPAVGQDQVCNAAYGKNGWLGLAQIWLTSDHITQGTTKVNDTYFNTSPYNTTPWRNLVMCQEVGHTFGLDHQDENFGNQNLGTCMDYTNSPTGGGANGPSGNEHPNQGDYDQLRCIYDPAVTKDTTLSTPSHSCTGPGHVDSTTTVGQNAATKTPAASDEGDKLNTPNGWGQLKKKSADGRFEVWERDLGNGSDKEKEKLVTFVIRPLETDKQTATKKNSRVSNTSA